MELGQKHEKTRLPPSHEPLRAPGKAKSGESKEGRETKAKRGRQKGREHSTGDRAESTRGTWQCILHGGKPRL